jgi:outer membrane receptor protein involved in Fe transport
MSMTRLNMLASSALRSAAFIAFTAGAASPLLAQPPAADPAKPAADQPRADAAPGATASAADATAESDQQIVVTGTRINRPNLTSTVPITSISSQELTNTGQVSLGDTLNELPQLRVTFSQANSTRFIGTSGISSLDLRGLGTARTLVLVNGRRIVTATPGVNRPDVNDIPTDLVDRVDIVTGGNSAVYGSDAVAGVVNFVLKRNLEGVRVRAQGGISSHGDRGSYFVAVSAGHNFADGRANIAVAAEYAKANTLYFTDRDAQTGAFSGRSQFNLVENTGSIVNPALLTNLSPSSLGTCVVGTVTVPCRPAEPSTGNGIPDNEFLTAVRNNSISEGGLFTATCPTAAAGGESAAAFAARRALACNGQLNAGSTNPLAQFGTTYVFLADGSLVKNPCISDLRGPTGGNSTNCIGGLGSTLRLTGMLEPGVERKAVTALGHFDVTDAFRPFFEAQFVRVKANQEGQPTFFNNSFSINNPFLTAQARSLLVQTLAPGTTTFTAQRFNIDFGGRGELHKRDNYQAVVGVDGTFNGDWRYEVTFNYGHLWTYYQTEGNVDRAKYANSINAVRNTAGQIVCGINADAVTTNDDPSCVPVNLFGNGQPSAAALHYFGYTSSRVQRANLYDGTAYVAGDLSQLFSLPGGPIGFVLGGEIRRETAFAAYDAFTSSTACGTAGCTFLNVIPNFAPPALVVKEAFGEINIPLLRDMPLAHELSIDAAGRFSHYNIGNTGTVFAWNVNGTYAPFRDLRFRGGYARAIRAPTQSDLYSPLSQTFLNGLVDPCGQQNINNNPNRVKNCAAAGVPTTQTFNGTTEPFSNRAASGISGFNGSNPSLKEERSTSLTIGGVFQPRFLPGFSLTVDYYDIKIKNVIFSLAAQTIINQCYDNPGGINNPFCAAVFRNPNGTFKGQSDVIHGGGTVSVTPTGPSFISGPFNFAQQITSGIDVDAAYRTRLSNAVSLNLRAIATHTFKKNNFTDVTNPAFAQRQLSVLGDPQWQGQISANLIFGMANFGYRMRYIGRQVVSTAYETQNPFQGRPPTNPDALPRIWYPDAAYHDFRIDLTVSSKYRFYLGVDNAFNKLPPFDLLGNEAGDPFSPVGRFFYAGAEVKF